MLNYQNLICYGDSQTNGARTYTSWPHYLALELEKRDGKMWNVIERAVNGYTAKDLLKMIQMDNVPNCSQACVMIGTNDCKEGTGKETFRQYIHRMVTALKVKGISSIIFGRIPPIWLVGGEYPYVKDSTEVRKELNDWLLTNINSIGTDDPFVLTRDCYIDAVHFNDKGNQAVAKLFAEAICNA